MSSAGSTSRAHPLARLLVLALLVLTNVLVGSPALAQDAESFGDLDPARHVYDTTGSSLDAAQLADVEERVARLGAAGADVVVVVRALDADSDDTFDQVEALHQEWARVSGTDRDRAAAVLVNRNPDDPTDARAGLFVGRAFAEGNVPEGEQRDIVEEALIPPLRDGDVRGGLVAALDRLESSIRSGPPVSAFDRFAADAARSWLPWTAIGLAAVGLIASLVLHRGRSRTHRSTHEPITERPDDLPPALGGALVAGGPPMQVVPAVLLDLAGRGAVTIEAEDEGSWASSPKVRVRLVDRAAVRDDVERVVWDRLAEKAEDGVVRSSHLASVSTWSGQVRDAVRAQMRERKWLDPRAALARGLLAVIAAICLVTGIFAMLLAGVGSGPLPAWIGAVALLAVAVTAFVLLVTYPALTPAGLEAAVPWTAYRDGLKAAAKDEDAHLDLDAALPDAVALGLGDALGERLKNATEAGVPLRAFASGRADDAAHLAAFPWWVAFSSSTAGTSSTGTVSGTGAGGGGGAAGST
ncbi:DUF2207 family protein [Pseudonocardia humida]|uniref:DUF2207 domain-containing protein n=1 Tax=Pseudonocardia humida TaxID=2800819 RepID=A0ABT0ZYE2_9PSEU|nr:TPM domain-containing protein [Pseudonocardia humida]MCO1655770.1 DUF2207 domain-containing protein [Pseudonocardia humida]